MARRRLSLAAPPAYPRAKPAPSSRRPDWPPHPATPPPGGGKPPPRPRAALIGPRRRRRRALIGRGGGGGPRGPKMAAEVAEALTLLAALRDQVAAVTAHARTLLRRVREGQFRTEQGPSLLELRPQLLLLYLQDLALLAGAKVGGASLGAEPALPRLLETRVVLEKMRPVEQRLKYQVEKLLRAAAAGALGDNDPLRFRPAPGNMTTREEEEEEEEEEGAAKAPGLGGGRRYVPPRLVPVQYAEAPPERAARERERERRLRRALSSSVLRELRQELSEAPEELPAGGGAAQPHGGRLQRERTRLEEAMLVRLSEGRRGRRRRGGAAGAESLEAVARFGAAGALLAPHEQDETPPKKRKKRPKAAKRKTKGFRRRR
ncbi:neuroguidin isoform X3 [Dromaius novaehollandiae]|uniref:neuroguidin isoform X3 n=1 Tax=Dromaius novaehollandiae TaxID=8790 RepID=UPI00311D5046